MKMKIQTTITIQIKDVTLELTASEAKELLSALKRELGEYSPYTTRDSNPWNPYQHKTYCTGGIVGGTDPEFELTIRNADKVISDNVDKILKRDIK